MTTTTETASLLNEWTLQVQALAEAPNEADEAVSQIHTSFGELHLWYSRNGDLETAQLIADAYNHVMEIYNQSLRYAQTFAVGQTVISELAAQRNDAVGELSLLLNAIRRGNDSHPALVAFVADIREETRADLLESETFMDEAVDWATDSLYVRVITTFSRYGLGGKWRAQILVDHLLGKKRMDDEQITALRAFLDTLS